MAFNAGDCMIGYAPMQNDVDVAESVVYNPVRQLQAAEHDFLAHDNKHLYTEYSLERFRYISW